MPQNGYTLILVEPGLSPTEFHLDPSPQDVRSEKTALTTLTPLPGMSAYRESHGNGFETVILQGTFGAKSRKVGGINWTGAEMFLAFRKGFWDKYLSLVGSGDPVKQNTKIEFHNWDEDEHYFAEPIRFVSPRGHENRTYFRYEFTLQLYEKIERKFLVPTTDQLTLADRAAKFFAAVLEKIKAAGEWLADKAEKVSSWINRYVIQPLNDLTNALNVFVAGVGSVVNLVNYSINAVVRLGNNIASTIEQFGAITGDLLTETANTLRNTKRMLNRLRNAPEMFKASVNAGVEELSEQYYELIESSDSEVVQAEKSGGRNLSLMQQAAKLKENLYQGAVKVTVRLGDTLQKIAVRQLRDASRWREIALINGLDTPNLFLMAGSEILVPTVPSVQGSGVYGDLGDDRKITNDTVAERLYGRDMMVAEQNGKLSIVFGANNDIDTVAGDANLQQAVGLKVRIYQGQLLEDSEFGIRRVVGRKGTPTETLALKHSLLETALSDPRIASAAVSISQDANFVTASYDLVPVGVAGSRPLNAVVGRI